MRRHHGAGCRHVGDFDQFHIEDEIGLGGDAGMVGTVGNVAGSVSELPGNEDAALATDSHAGKTVVEAGNDAADALRERHGLGIAHLRLAIGAKFGFAIFAHDRTAVLIP